MKKDCCKHFTGVTGAQDDRCAAGVAYGDYRNGDGAYKLPCYRHPEIPCEKRQYPTADEIAAEKAEVDALLERTGKAVDEIRATGLPYGLIPCPCACGGQLRFSIASNNHIRARCSTDGCVEFMQ